jgi:hypothetical protein
MDVTKGKLQRASLNVNCLLTIASLFTGIMWLGLTVHMQMLAAKVTTFDICRFQGVTALALTTLWKPWVFAIH